NEDNIHEEISPDGNIIVEQLGPIYLNGLTVKEANEKIRRIFARKYADVMGDKPLSDVRLTLGQIRTISVSVMGEVYTPGTYRLSAFASLFHALYSAGGVTDIGSLRNIRVMRNGEEVATADLYEYLFNGKTADDIRLKEGDVIVVPPYESLVTVQGRVKRPMYYEVKKGEPLGALLGYAGGFAGDAYSSEVALVRQTGKERRFYSVNESKYDSFGLEDGDSVRVGATLNRFANRVEVQGSVFRPGMYELSDEMNTVRALIARADGPTEDAFLNRAQILREKEDLTKEMVAVDLQGILSGSVPDVMLRRNDVLMVPSIQELQEFGAFTIDGEVAWPGLYPYADNTTVEDLIIQAGGLLESASTAQVDVMR
ncbi:MAG: SLBB domain-containing protein, partial [Alistipes sp.]|nr:SLBB domain-containing protein [Alistipes sp.]